MSRDRHEVESEIVLPAGMELVVPPPPRDEGEPVESSGSRRRAGDSAERVALPPFGRRGDLRRAPVA